MSVLVVFTGGVRSGKSRHAAELAGSVGRGVVVAVAGAPIDQEMERRIAGHRADRPNEWGVLEIGADPFAALARVSSDRVLLLDCLGSVAGRIVGDVFEEARATEGEGDDGLASPEVEWLVEERVSRVTDLLVTREGDTVVVTNEVGDGVVPPSASGRVFRDVLGRANQRLVLAADRAYLVVAGACIDLARAAGPPAWPETS
jgi:adenosylcobinamide kinase/adenosylcobinamide-phosphate guanylyltransferase